MKSMPHQQPRNKEIKNWTEHRQKHELLKEDWITNYTPNKPRPNLNQYSMFGQLQNNQIDWIQEVLRSMNDFEPRNPTQMHKDY